MAKRENPAPNACWCGYVGTGVIVKHAGHKCATCEHLPNQHTKERGCGKCWCRRFVKRTRGRSVRTVGSALESKRCRH